MPGRPPRPWRNWSGSISFTPAARAFPKDENDVRRLVRDAAARGGALRMAGAGHSSSPLVETAGTLMSLGKMSGVVFADPLQATARVLPGTTVAQAGRALVRHGLSLPNTGDVDRQQLAGAFATGTHGSGRRLQNLSAMMTGCRLVDGHGDVHAFSRAEHPEIMRAVQVSLGALGCLTELTLQLRPARIYHRREYCLPCEDFDGRFEALAAANEMFDFYWYPQTNMVKLRTCNPEGEGMQDIPFAAYAKGKSGWLHEALPKKRTMKFEEMEYALPYDAGLACFQDVRRRVLDRHLHYVWWRLLFRTVAADDAYLSPFTGRDSATIAVLQNHDREYQSYFADIEPILRAYGGRPHWGKKHSLGPEDLSALYPDWEKFLALRETFDPGGVFLNDYLRETLGLG